MRSFKGGTRGTFSLSSFTSTGNASLDRVVRVFSIFASGFRCFEVKNFLFDFFGGGSSSICCSWLGERIPVGSLRYLLRLWELFFGMSSSLTLVSSFDSSAFFQCFEALISETKN